jgi:hypothetical protein
MRLDPPRLCGACLAATSMAFGDLMLNVYSRPAWLGAAAIVTVLYGAARAARAWERRRRSVDRRDWSGRRGLVDRITAEFAEMPGMSLTLSQACRLLGMGSDLCERVLDTLVNDGVLRYTADKRYVRSEASA